MQKQPFHILSRVGLFPAVLCAAFIAEAARAEQWLTSPPMTFRFGIEQDWPASVRMDNAHIDLDVNYTGAGTFEGAVHSEEEELERDAAHVYANASTRRSLTSVPSFLADALGVGPNEDFWVLQQSQVGGQTHLGLASHETDMGELLEWNPGDVRGGANIHRTWLQVQLVAFRPPTDGVFAMWQTTTSGQTLFQSSHANEIDASDVAYIAPGGHMHFNWGFTKAGLWEIEFQIRTLTSLDWLEGDANHDHAVNFDDLLVLAQNYGKPLGGYWDIGDFNGDFAVGFDDLLLLAQNYGNTAMTDWALAQSLVPEPGLGAVFFVGASLLCARRRPL